MREFVYRRQIKTYLNGPDEGWRGVFDLAQDGL
jgi:hypothetical protein